MYFELRQYRLMPGKREKFVKKMEEIIIPYFASKGKLCFGSFLSIDDPNEYIWIFGRFESPEERQEWSKGIYEDPYYQDEIINTDEEMFGVKLAVGSEKIKVTRLEPTPCSFIK